MLEQNKNEFKEPYLHQSLKESKSESIIFVLPLALLTSR